MSMAGASLPGSNLPGHAGQHDRRILPGTRPSAAECLACSRDAKVAVVAPAALLRGRWDTTQGIRSERCPVPSRAVVLPRYSKRKRLPGSGQGNPNGHTAIRDQLGTGDRRPFLNAGTAYPARLVRARGRSIGGLGLGDRASHLLKTDSGIEDPPYHRQYVRRSRTPTPRNTIKTKPRDGQASNEAKHSTNN
jgi:hypothetical protein